MSTINHQKLRELAFALQRMATPQKLLAFRAMLSPSAVLALLDQLEHARTTAPAIRLTLHHEIADFCATLGALANRKRRKQCSKSCCNASITFLIFSEPVRNQNMHTQKTACHASIGQVTFPLHLIKRVPGFSTRYRAKRITAQAVFCAYCIATSFSRQNYGGAYGADFGRAGFLLSGVENPVRLATPRFSTLDGELFLSPSKEATPWQTANSTALSRSVVTSD